MDLDYLHRTSLIANLKSIWKNSHKLCHQLSDEILRFESFYFHIRIFFLLTVDETGSKIHFKTWLVVNKPG